MSFLFLGRFIKEKGIIELVEVGKRLWKERQDFKLRLLGSVDRGNPSSLTKEDVREFSDFPFLEVVPFAKDVRPFSLTDVGLCSTIN